MKLYGLIMSYSCLDLYIWVYSWVPIWNDVK